EDRLDRQQPDLPIAASVRLFQEIECPFDLPQAQMNDGRVPGRDVLGSGETLQVGQSGARLRRAAADGVNVRTQRLRVHPPPCGRGGVERLERLVVPPLLDVDGGDEEVRRDVVWRTREHLLIGGERL